MPAEARHRWGLSDGGAVEVVDLGDALVVLPTGAGGLRAMLAEAIEESGGYAALAAAVAADEPDLA